MRQPGDWTIRPVGAEAADALALVGAATFLDAYADVVDGAGLLAHCAQHHSAEAYRGYLANGAAAWLAETAQGAPVGYALACAPELEQAREGDRELKRIYVLSRFSGCGMAAALMDAVVADAAQHSRLLLGVKNDNWRALRFYEKHGFSPVGTRTFQVGGACYEDLVLARDLHPATTESR